MKIRIKGIYSKKKRLASGQIAQYFYDRTTGARLPDDRSSASFHLAVERLRRTKAKPVPHARSFAQLVTEYRQSLKYKRLKESTRKEYDRHIRYLSEVLSSASVKDIHKRHVEIIMKKFADTPTLALAIKRTLSILLAYAKDRLEWIDTNVCHGMETARDRREVGQKPYSEAEIAKFRAMNPVGSRARLIFETALGTAIRISDVGRIPPDAFESGSIHILTNKTGAEVVAGVTKQMLEAWRAWEAHRRRLHDVEPEFAVCAENGARLHKRTISEDMREAFERAGFEEGQRTHALRYTACVRMLESGYSYDDIAELTGHSMASMAKKYTQKRRAAQVRVRIFNSIDDEGALVE